MPCQRVTYRDDRRANSLSLHNNRIVTATVREARCIVVDVLDLYDDQTVWRAAGVAAAAAAIVARQDVEAVGDGVWIEVALQTDDARASVDSERSLHLPAAGSSVTVKDRIKIQSENANYRTRNIAKMGMQQTHFVRSVYALLKKFSIVITKRVYHNA